jgi:hypothetical protein
LLHWQHQIWISTRICLLFGNKQWKIDDSDVATGMNYGVASFSSWSKSTCNPKTGLVRIRGSPKTTASIWRWTPWKSTDKPVGTYLPKGKPLGFHMVGWKYPVHPDTPTMIGWSIGGRGHWKSGPRKATYSTIPASRSSTLDSPWDPG